MSYPDDKDTFREVTGYVSGPVVDDNKVKAGDQNNTGTWLENFQDTMGYGIKMGYATVKAFFDWIVTQFGLVLYKAGGTMAGILNMDDNKLQFKGDKTEIKYSDDHGGLLIESTNLQPDISTVDGLGIWANTGADGSGSWLPGIGLRAGGILSLWPQLDKWVLIHGLDIRPQVNNNTDIGTDSARFKKGFFTDDIAISNSAKGLILNSATKKWRVTINDSGTLITTDIT